MISETEVKAEKVLDAAHRRVPKLSEDIHEMKALPAFPPTSPGAC